MVFAGLDVCTRSEHTFHRIADVAGCGDEIAPVLAKLAIESAEASLEQVTGDKDSKLYQLWSPTSTPTRCRRKCRRRYQPVLRLFAGEHNTCYAGH